MTKPENRRRRLTLIVLTAALALSLGWRLWQHASERGPVSRRSVSGDYLTRSAEVMATRLEVVLPRGHEAAAELVFYVFRRVDAQMSEWKQGSPLATVNRAAGAEAVVVPEDLRSVIQRGLELSRLTEGAFDLTWAALWGVWDFRASQPRIPEASVLRQRVALVDYREVELDDRAGTVRLRRAGMKLGLGGIAKGHALDQVAALLRRSGVPSFMVSAGGQVLVGGRRGDRPWRVGIRHPRGARDEYLAVLHLTDTSASTSGDYEHYFVRDGVRYHHIIDPRTGMPARGLRSATVISRDATLADALSTALMVLGRERALALVERRDDVEAVLIDDQGRLHASRGARRLLGSDPHP